MYLMKASEYYRRKGPTGWVLVHPSGPYHFPGPQGEQRAEQAMAKAEAIEASYAKQATKESK
jgi:hypothetical protein